MTLEDSGLFQIHIHRPFHHRKSPNLTHHRIQRSRPKIICHSNTLIINIAVVKILINETKSQPSTAPRRGPRSP